MIRIAIFAVSLLVLWLLLSGIYNSLIVTLGIISCLLTTVIAVRMKIVDEEGLLANVSVISLLRYWVWLIIEIAKANWSVAKTVVSPKLSLQQKILTVPTSQKSDMGKVIFANSITLTPGTITVETEGDGFLVHALTDEAADMDALGDMDNQVAGVEKPGGRT